MIQMHFSTKEDVIYPIVTCDQCGQRITDATMANVLYAPPDHSAPPPHRVTQLCFVHKACHDVFEHRHRISHGGGTFLFWIDLYEFLGQLVYRVGLAQSEARRLSGRAPWNGTEGAVDD